MKKTLGSVLFLVLGISPALAQKIAIDYAHDFDFSKLKTFEYVETKETNSKDPLMDSRIKNAIIRQLESGGLKQVDSNPDIFVTYHVATKDETVYNTTSFGYGGWGPGWGAWGGGMGMGSSTTTPTTFTEGTLVVDGYEPKDKKMVWRGTGTVTLKAKPEKVTQQIDNIVAKMGQRWQAILKNQGK